MAYPASFESQKKYDAYLSCINNAKVGDEVLFRIDNNEYRGIFLYSFPFVALSSKILYHRVMLGLYNCNDLFYNPSYSDKIRLKEIKKTNKNILISKIKTYNIDNYAAQIVKIIKVKDKK